MTHRLIITGLNGAGKSHVAARLSAARPDLKLISYDAVRLLDGWRKRPAEEIKFAMQGIVKDNNWIIEGGPTVLNHALERATGVLWIDPPVAVRAWRLFRRPWTSLGKTRPELPDGNIDWPLQQYRFALRSLTGDADKRSALANRLSNAPLWHCRTSADIAAALRDLSSESR